MAFSKADQFKSSDQTLADLGRALSHPARIAILKTLAARNECVCGEIVEALPLAQSTVSQHLKALREAGLIKGEIEGPKSCYCINRQAITELETLLAEFVKSLRGNNSQDCC
jgi:DNA-binding transcriptional ArsR family regulator